MRRAAQFAFERDAPGIGWPDLEAAPDELLIRGGSLNRKLLGAGRSGRGVRDRGADCVNCFSPLPACQRRELASRACG